MPYRTLNLDQVAEYLHVSRADVEGLVHHREIPFERPGGRLVFRKKDIDVWASQRILGLPGHRLESYHRGSSRRTSERTGRRETVVGELLRQNLVEPALASKTRAAAIRDLVELATRTDAVLDPSELLASLQAREALCSTALPGGVAVLHPRHQDPYLFSESFVLLARAMSPIPFGAPDGQKTDLFFLICCQDDRIHLHVLARICLMCSQTPLLGELRQAEDAPSMIAAIESAEKAVTGTGRSPAPAPR